MTSVDGSSQRLLLELDIKAKRELIALNEADYLKVVFEDATETDPYQKVIDLFSGVNTARAQRYSISAILKQGKSADAELILNNYLGAPSEDHYASFKALEIDLTKRGLNWFQMSTAERTTLDNIAVDDSKRGYEAARSVISLIDDENPTSFAKPYDLSPPSARMMAPETYDFSSAPKIMEAYPQPANGEFYINTQLPDNYRSASIRLVDITGKLIDHIDLNHVSLLQVKSSKYPSGMYFAELIVDDISVESLKINIIH